MSMRAIDRGDISGQHRILTCVSAVGSMISSVGPGAIVYSELR